MKFDNRKFGREIGIEVNMVEVFRGFYGPFHWRKHFGCFCFWLGARVLRGRTNVVFTPGPGEDFSPIKTIFDKVRKQEPPKQ